jgi:hypothetical protein
VRSSSGRDWAIAAVVTALLLAAWPTAGHYDDGAIYERYAANAARGLWSTYDATRGPVWGQSGLLYGLAAGSLTRAGATPRDALVALDAAGTALTLFVLARLAGPRASLAWRWGFALLGLAAAPHLAVNLRQLLETPMHVGLVLAAVHLTMRERWREALAAAALLVPSKLDAAPVSLLLAAVASRDLLRARGPRAALTALGLCYVAPLAAYLAATWCAFGSLLPHSAAVKFLLYPRRPSSPSVISLWLAAPAQKAALLAAVVGAAVDARRARSLRPALPLASAACVAAVYVVYAPAEAMTWYAALPEALVSAQLVASGAQFMALAGRQVLAAAVAVIAGVSCIPPLAGAFAEALSAIEASEGAGRLTRLARAVAQPEDALATCMGVAAREWPGPIVDTCGINDTRAAEALRAGLDPVTSLRPPWALTVGSGRTGYLLVASAYDHAHLGWRAWRLLRRADAGARPHRELLAGDVLEGAARRVASVEVTTFAGSLRVEGHRVRLRLTRGGAASRLALGVERLPHASRLFIAACGRAQVVGVEAAAWGLRTESVAVEVRCAEGSVWWESGERVVVLDPVVE